MKIMKSNEQLTSFLHFGLCLEDGYSWFETQCQAQAA